MKSPKALTAILVLASTLILVAGILLPPYFRARSERAAKESFSARAQPVMDEIIKAEAAYKEREGKFWRDREQTISAEATKSALGVDISGAEGLRFSIAPPDLVADPTLRIEATPTDGPSLLLSCLYDSIEKVKNCKPVG